MEKKAKRQRAETRKDRKRRERINRRGMMKRNQKINLNSVYFLSIILGLKQIKTETAIQMLN